MSDKQIVLNRITDLDTLMKWRVEVIENVFGVVPSAEILQANRDYYLRHIKDFTHLAFVAEFGGEEAGCGAVCFSEELPSPDNPDGKCAYLMNIYVRENYRKHGIGAHIVENLIASAKSQGCEKIYLETTDQGRPVYTSLGFHDMPDMMKL